MAGHAFPFTQFPILAHLDQQVQDEIAAHARRRTYRAGQMILLAQEPSQAVYLIAEGRVRSQRSSLQGREYVLHDLGAGECFNLASVFDSGYNLDTVTALTDSVLYAVPARAFLRIAGKHPALSMALLPHMARRVRHLRDAAEGLALYDVRIRLARCLLACGPDTQESARAPDGGWHCPSHLTQNDLAAQIGSVRDVVGRMLRTFSSKGLIRREGSQVVVTDLAGLRREALREPAAQPAL
jgi:CRP-like cAMP-binding protein